MSIFQPLQELEKNEELLRVQLNALSKEQKKSFYAVQSKNLKDPDTYAALNWFFIGGIHHFYLRKYALFVTELILLTLSIIGLFLGYESAIYIIILLCIYELPQLFFSQKIARQYNYNMSCDLLNEVRQNN